MSKVEFIENGEMRAMGPDAIAGYAAIIHAHLQLHQDHMIQYTPEALASAMQQGLFVLAVEEGNRQTVKGGCKLTCWGEFEWTDGSIKPVFELGTLMSFAERQGIGSGLVLEAAKAFDQYFPDALLIAIVDNDNVKSLNLFDHRLQAPELAGMPDKAKEVILAGGWEAKSKTYNLTAWYKQLKITSQNNGKPS